MSGIEVAGLVLGAFPIVIAGLEKYRDVARRMGFWYKIRSEYQRSSNELIFHRLSFEQNLTQLLFPLVGDDGQLQDLIEKPGGLGWNDPALQQALETRLRKSYRLYLEIMDEMQETMQKLNKELSVDNTQLQSRIRDEKNHHAPSPTSATSRLRKSLSQSNLEYQLFRVKFSLGESTRTQLFSELQTYNDRLEKLIFTSDSISQLRCGHQASTSKLATLDMSAALCKFWTHADRLYNALMGAWGCACHEQHFAELILQHRQPHDNDFRVTFSPGNQEENGAGTSPWPRCPVQLRMHEQNQTTALKLLSPEESTSGVKISLSTPHHGLQQLARTGFSNLKRTKRLKIFQEITHSVSQSNTAASTICSKQQEPVATENIIDNLCGMLGNSIGPLCFIECRDDIRYHLTNLTSEEYPATHSSICLSEILSGEVKPLTRRQRYHLSMTIASSFVQLKDTPWLRTPWDKDGVYFSHIEDQNRLLLESPFIVQSFASRSTSTAPNIGHDVASIALLGIVLLELCFGTSIDQHPSRLKYPGGDEQVKAAFDLVTAIEWLKDVNEEAGVDYSEAVEWCLVGCRTLPNNEVWRRLMVEKVVVPLERCYHYLDA